MPLPQGDRQHLGLELEPSGRKLATAQLMAVGGWALSSCTGLRHSHSSPAASFIGSALCSHRGLQTSQAGGTNGGSTFPKLRWSEETPKCHPVLSGSGVVPFFFLPGSWAIGPARCFRAGGLLTLQEPGRQLQKAKLQCIPIFQNRKNKTNQSRCSNM